MLILKNVLYYLFPDLQLVLYNADAEHCLSMA